jgi:Flp pilus assembly protein TadD/predicted  nucleic acid-binding Zn-ribbon protein
MPRLPFSLSLFLLAVAVPLRALPQGTDSTSPPSDTTDATDAASDTADSSDLFLNAYMANEQGEKLENAGDSTKALEKYRYAASLLDQISHDDPNWQPIVVDYRKKRVAQNITRLQQQLGSQPSGPEASSVPIEGELPQKDSNPIPNLNENPPPQPPIPSTPLTPAEASQQVRDQISELEDELRDSRQKLKSVETDKEALAGRLDQALKQLDQSQVSVTELKGQLQQAQDAYQNSLSDHSQSPAAQKQYKDRLTQLQDALENAEADRDAADQQNADFSRRALKARQATALIVQQRDSATAHAQDLQSKFADASKLAGKLDDASKQIAALTKDRDSATQHANDLDKELADTSKTAAKLVDAQKQIAALKADAAQTAAKNDEISGKLADARKQIDQITADRDTARAQVTALDGKLADAQSQIVSVKAERDQIATQRDQALAELSKARAAEKRVTELLADNTSLTQKLSADEKTIKDFKSDSPEKDKQIADLRKEVSDTKALLATAQQDKDNVQSSLNDLQQQFDTTSAELTELKANNSVSATEKKTLTDENGLLRDIVVRELKKEAVRDQTKRLVMDQLSQLNIQSDSLLKQIAYLGEPVLQLTDKEKALFKDPTLDIPDPAESTMDINIAAPKQPSTTHPLETPTPAPQDSPSPVTAVATPSPSATPIQLASRDTTGASQVLPPAPASSPAAGNPESASSIGDTSTNSAGSPMVPPDLENDARDAKDAFERADYHSAEKIYEQMLAQAPNNVYILSNLGVVYFRNEKWKLSEESLQKAIAVAPEDVFSHTTLGIVYYQEKRYDDAINSLTRALTINPKYAVAHNYLGITASQKGWQEAAIKELETAIDIDPNYADANFNLAVVYAMQQPPNKELAAKYYHRAVDLGAEPDAGLEQLIK